MPAGRRQAGFTLIEMSIALVLLLVGILIAADLLMESARLFAETSGEALDTPVPAVVARIRADVQGATAVVPEQDVATGALVDVQIQSGGQEIVYRKVGDTLFREVVTAGGLPQDPEALWRGVTRWSCEQGGKDDPAILSVTYRRRTTPHTPLPVLPVYRGPLAEEKTETLFLLPRGNGW